MLILTPYGRNGPSSRLRYIIGGAWIDLPGVSMNFAAWSDATEAEELARCDSVNVEIATPVVSCRPQWANGPTR